MMTGTQDCDRCEQNIVVCRSNIVKVKDELLHLCDKLAQLSILLDDMKQECKCGTITLWKSNGQGDNRSL